ncbi:hypothetical protein ACHWQZ_G016627 [Mnemiopsis leidyi]
MTTLEALSPFVHPDPSPTPLKHSIESLLNPKKTMKQVPLRPSPRYRPYSLPDILPSPPSTNPPPSTSSLTVLEQHLVLLKQLQQQVQLSNYISTHEQTETPQFIPVPARRSKPILTSTLISSIPPPNLHPAPGPTRKRRSAVVTTGTSSHSSSHSCTAITCTSSLCPHRITPNTPLNRRQVRSAESRYRTHLTTEQKDALQLVFSETIYLTKTRRRLLSEETGLKEDTISVWFQNRRRLLKKKQENTPRV